MNYKEAMDYMKSIENLGMVLGLDTIRELLERLGSPQDKLSFVHVAGTNGKGSVCTYMSSILMEAGAKVGRYISPAVFHYRERIQVDGRWILEDDFAKHVEKLKEAAASMVLDGLAHPTPFEIETGAAFLEFVDKKCDIVVLETGLGGRLDSTNVIKTPLCGVFTSISMDHMGMLGDTIEKIALEKSGIIKENMDAISYPQTSEVEEILRSACVERGGRFYQVNLAGIKNPVYTLEKTEFDYTPSYSLAGCTAENGPLHLEGTILGENQVKNMAAAVEGILCLGNKGFTITKEHIQRGMKKAVWPGRFSVVWKKPLVIADGAHNEEAAIALKRSENLYFKGRRIIRIIGVFKDKEYEKILKNTVEPKDLIIAAAPQCERGLPSKELARCAGKYCNNVIDGRTVENGLSIALSEAKEQDVILVYGSLSFLHEVYQFFQKEMR